MGGERARPDRPGPLAQIAADAAEPGYRTSPRIAPRASTRGLAAGTAAAGRERRRRIAVTAAAAVAGLLAALLVVLGRGAAADARVAEAILAAAADARSAGNRAAGPGPAPAPAGAGGSAAAEPGGADPLAAAGGRAEHGPGLRVLVSDPTALGPGPGGSEGSAVRDRDLAEIVDVLFAAGAEAIAVGGVRLTATSAIRAAGPAILVGFHALTSPYTIDAIGPGPAMKTTLSASPVWARLLADGDVGVRAGGQLRVSLTVPAATLTLPALARRIP